MNRHSFAKENRSTIKVILELIMKVEKILSPYSSSLEAYESTQLFITYCLFSINKGIVFYLHLFVHKSVFFSLFEMKKKQNYYRY